MTENQFSTLNSTGYFDFNFYYHLKQYGWDPSYEALLWASMALKKGMESETAEGMVEALFPEEEGETVLLCLVP